MAGDYAKTELLRTHSGASVPGAPSIQCAGPHRQGAQRRPNGWLYPPGSASWSRGWQL